jgi:hypothetical protein
MPKATLMDEFHVPIYVPRGIPSSESHAIRQGLDHPTFRAELRHAVWAVIRRWPALRKVRVTIKW